MTSIEVEFKVVPKQPAADILIAQLSEIGFDGFIETDNGVKAYISKDHFDNSFDKELQVLKTDLASFNFTIIEMEDQNWNENWENSFDPILVENRCIIRAPFHNSSKMELEVVIEPKMSFGTGHHETTYLMVKEMLNLNMKGLNVLDMGCGTAVLAILAEKLGARSIKAIDIEEWAYNNSLENIKLNDCQRIIVNKGDASLLSNQRFNIIFANINRNILIQDIPIYANVLESSGDLLLSGFFSRDKDILLKRAENYHLRLYAEREKNDWTLLHLKKDIS